MDKKEPKKRVVIIRAKPCITDDMIPEGVHPYVLAEFNEGQEIVAISGVAKTWGMSPYDLCISYISHDYSITPLTITERSI